MNQTTVSKLQIEAIAQALVQRGHASSFDDALPMAWRLVEALDSSNEIAASNARYLLDMLTGVI